MEINKVCVVGAGYMGNGIAEMAALAGYRVCLHDLTEERLEAGMSAIRNSLARFLARDKITQEAHDAALAAIQTVTGLEAARDADIAVEAVSEDLELKRRIFVHLDEVCPAHALLATNTSAIPISSIAAATERPQQVVGTHFFGPVPMMRLCEIIRGIRTSDATFEAADAWARSLGKETVLVQRDHAGFIANRLNIPATLEMVRMVESGMPPALIDRAASFGLEGRIGPLEILDNAGLDISLGAASAIYDDTADTKFFPPPLLRRMVAAGLLGRKTGRGFYDYSGGAKQEYELLKNAGGEAPPFSGEEPDIGQLGFRLLLPTVVEAVLMLQAGVASADDIDRATRLGFNFPIGPLELADNTGLDTIMNMTRSIYEETGDPKYFPPPLLASMVQAGHVGRAAGRGFYVY